MILAKGRPRTYTLKAGDEELDQISGMLRYQQQRDELAGFYVKTGLGRPKT